MVPRDSEILEKLREKGSRIVSFRDLARKLHVRDRDEDALRERLEALERRGDVSRVRGEKYSAIEFTNQVAGRITVRPEGFGFLLVKDGPDLYIPRAGMHGAMDGDTVLAREERTRSRGRAGSPDRTAGTVVKVLDRARERVVGRFEKQDGRAVVLPYDPRIDAIVRIADGRTHGAREGEIVEVRLTSFPDARRVAQGVVEERLGFLGEPGVDIEIVLRSHGLPPRFPEPVIEEAERFPLHVRTEDLLGRRDFRDRRIVTIDGETAKDFDDAVEIERTASGFRLGVHIADVSHYVREGTALDDEARSRGTSVYFPGRVLPMLPEHLSNGLCSLNPGVERLVLSALIETDRKGRVVSADFVKGVIKSSERMTYTEVARLLEIGPAHADKERYGPLLEDFRDMAALAAKLRERREARGSIDFDLPDADVVLDDAGLVVGIVPESRNVAHRLIEEFMLAANEAVAKKLLFAKQPAIYRVHDPPDPDRLVDLREVLEDFGYELKGDLDEIPPSAFQKILKAIEGNPEERLLTDLILRAQRKALYSEECRGHYALAAPYYCHFTSPIRRYPDLVVHRQLSALIEAGRPVAPKDFETINDRLREIAAFSSDRERRAEAAERESLLWKKIVFMKDKIGREFDAYVTGVTQFGLFVTLQDFFVEGLVPVSSLGDDFYVYEEKQHRLRGRSGGKVFRLGDSIRVQLKGIDEVRRRLDFRIAGAASARPEPRVRKARAAGR
ncbi:MAG TPA: ribonuclease R [Thermoanaerobaculia bacterium]|nr:ribonuclease R [Thermoanaerobaculia bacterium]HEV8608838.1 ribonuclease R [Thermoanaerobaculia bacterium]